MHKEQINKDLAMIRRGACELIGEEDLRERLAGYYAGDKPLIIKLGLDPTAPDIHLGHTVVLRKIRQFQDLGHKAILIIGDFTGRIGDPTGKNKTRPNLSEKEVLNNADTYQKQIMKILNPDQTILCFNSEWLETLSLKTLIELLGKQSLQRLLERESFKNRMTQNNPIFLHELIYPLLQGYDSMAIQADLEIGGMDQRFNMLMGRDMQGRQGLNKQAALFMPLLEGIDGKEKMSKSLGNYVGINESATVMLEKLMKVPDPLVARYLLLLTNMHESTIEAKVQGVMAGHIHPKDFKMEMALMITSQYHTIEVVKEAKKTYMQVHEEKEPPKQVPVVALKSGIGFLQFLLSEGYIPSLSEGRRLISGGGIRINGEKVQTLDPVPNSGDIIQVGKKKYLKVG